MGKLCPTRDMAPEGWVHDITLFSQRADAVAAWMSGVEISTIQADLLSREFILNVDFNTHMLWGRS